ncbi:hypothetical protein D8674_018491 [Pyrus ussuriensis x Pyrus communis]|uniref:Uncharacterized protein n=1 Tax=Pyrus ussuriensis x Pyrus communis TaxID=2448454 RepID=A0A5N5G4Y6_9ROSA|nr:hypothetical protein D8674_018491 [Pyrus ussuriensis x Pyrus communis]
MFREDRIVWPATRNEVYSVRSGYHWKHACLRLLISRASSSSSIIPNQVWRCIWKLMTPPKIRNFMWRALSRALATMEDLFKRRCSPSPCCPICFVQDESVEHMLLLCPWVEPIWFCGPLNYRVNRTNISNLPAWVSSFFGIFPNRVIMSILNSVNGFMVATCTPEGRPQRVLSASIPQARWFPPSHLFMKLNVDASWEANSKSGFAGIVVRNHKGNFVAAKKVQIGAPSVAAAEASAILLGCDLARSLGLDRIIVDSDSKKNILNLAKASSSGSWEAFPFLSKALRLKGSFQDCRWSWVPRSANAAAHKLASRRNPEMCGFTWVNHPPSSLVHVLNKDGLPCPH